LTITVWALMINASVIVRTGMDVNEHENLSFFTLRHTILKLEV
jgi:hypothetical protein